MSNYHKEQKNIKNEIPAFAGMTGWGEGTREKHTKIKKELDSR
jgi:hypothetical protein